MKALLLAAGLGTRLRPLTFVRAKATLPLLDVPFVRYPLQYLHANGVQDVVINLHSHPESVKKAGGDSYGGMNIEYSYEPEILGTAGAMKKASEMLGQDPFVVMNGDMLTNIPIDPVMQQHMQIDADVTLVVMKSPAFERYSGLHFQRGEPIKLSAVKNGEGEKYHYTGLQIVSPRVLSRIPENQKTEVFRDIYPAMIPEGRIYGFLYEGLWKEVGTLQEYWKTSLHLLREPLPESLQPAGIRPQLISPASTIEDHAEVIDTIVMEGATIKSGTSVKRSIVGWDASVTGKWRDVVLARGFLPWYM